jgi:hypothetical protein
MSAWGNVQIGIDGWQIGRDSDNRLRIESPQGDVLEVFIADWTPFLAALTADFGEAKVAIENAADESLRKALIAA